MNALAEVLSYFVHTCPNSDKNKTPVSIMLDFRASASRLHIICPGGLIIHHGARRSILSSDKRAVIEPHARSRTGAREDYLRCIAESRTESSNGTKSYLQSKEGGEKEARTEFEPQLDGVMRVLDEVPTWKEPCR